MTFKTLGTNFPFIVISTTIRGDAKKKTRKFVKEKNKREKKRRNSNERV
jgi:hypothetical protein